MLTSWPIIWTRQLHSSQQIARRNALHAAQVLAVRRAERDEVQRYLAEREEAKAQRLADITT